MTKIQVDELEFNDDFSDVLIFNKESLKKVWDNKSDECWEEYF